MENNFDIIKLTDEDVYFILYLNKVKELSLRELAEQFSVSRDSVKKIVEGRSRKKCYKDFRTLEKHLKEPS